MPDMSLPLAHLEELSETLRYKWHECREQANVLATRAEIWEDAHYRARDALDKERKKLAELGKSAE